MLQGCGLSHDGWTPEATDTVHYVGSLSIMKASKYRINFPFPHCQDETQNAMASGVSVMVEQHQANTTKLQPSLGVMLER